jgi:hypothetical protein
MQKTNHQIISFKYLNQGKILTGWILNQIVKNDLTSKQFYSKNFNDKIIKMDLKPNHYSIFPKLISTNTWT